MPKSNVKNAPSATRQPANRLADIAENTLSFFSETASRAKSLLDENHVMGQHAGFRHT